MRNTSLLIILVLLVAACSEKQMADTEVKQGSVLFDSVVVKPVGYEYPKDSTFKVLSWNVEHFIDSYDDPYIDNERENNPPENMHLRLGLLLEAFKKADADIVVLQEFESAKFLKQLANDSLPDMGYKYFADIPSHNWYMNVVVMSRFPMGIINGYGSVTTPLPGYFNEEGEEETQNQINTRMWSVDVFPSEDYTFLLTGVHLKAGRGERNIAMRKGQLNLLVSRFNELLQLNPDKNMMVAGDLNAIPGSEELALLMNNPKLINPFTDPVDTAVYSHPANSPGRRLDYMLVNRNMYREAQPGTIKVDTFFSPDTMRIISDHLPLTGSFTKKDKPASL